jgi:polysaccharide export outer membrane protein
MQATSRKLTAPLRATPAAGVFHAILSMLLLIGISACSVVPGTHTYDMREQSSVKLPVKEANEVAPANVKVVPITAELIIQQENTRKTATTSADRNAKAGPTYPAMTDYKLGPGDIINVTVWDHPELTIPAGMYRSAEETGYLVDASGNFFFPYAGTLHVDGKTIYEVRDILSKKLAKVVEKPQVDVRVVSFRSKRIYVVGEVKQPGLLAITDIPATIIEAVNKVGGFTNEADHSQVLLTRDGTTWRVDLQALYEDGATGQNVLLQAGDIINVPDRQLNKVFVLGEVKKPGSMVMNKKRLTLAEALADAGYIEQLTSNPHWIFVMRGQGDKPELFHLDSKSPDALLLADRFPLRARDIVFVDAAEVARWNRVITNILPTASLLNSVSGIDYPLFGGRQ